MSVVDARAKPYCLEGNKGIFCLLIHGFTGSPADMSVLARHLHMKGYSVSGILLPGHGTTPQEMAKTSWSDWYGAVEDEYMRLKSRNATASVIPMGLSMGGPARVAFGLPPQGTGCRYLQCPCIYG